MIRSRLRRPTSKSMTAVLCPRCARPAAKLALVVVLPTPPLPDVITMIVATCVLLSARMLGVLANTARPRRSRCGRERRNDEPVAIQRHLRRLVTDVRRQIVFHGTIDACDCDQLGL